MRNKVVLVVIGLLVTVSLVLGACGQDGEDTTKIVTEEEQPEYGGKITVIQATDITSFDTGVSRTLLGAACSQLVYQQHMTQDWSRGQAGTGEFDYGSGYSHLDTYGPQLAESWETPTPDTWILKIRRGVHWALNPDSEASQLMNGREMTADDVVASFNRLITSPSGFINLSQPVVAAAASAEKTGPWEVTLKVPVEPATGWFWLIWGGGYEFVYPPEVVEKYGDIQDWRNAVGTGPYMLTDFVPGSYATLIKNPDYWHKNPCGLGKGDQLPYIDEIEMLIIPDLSTRLATVRTGKADMIAGIEQADAKGLISTASQLKYRTSLPAWPYGIGMRTDNPDLPFKDKRVRQALMLATDFNSIKDDYYRGEAEILVWPITSVYKDNYVPMEELPESVQELYSYNPTKAKELLTEAGYPNGFNAKIVVQNVPSRIDVVSLIKAMWEEVGVNLEIEPVEFGAFMSYWAAKGFEHMIHRDFVVSFPASLTFMCIRGTSGTNASYINDPPGSDPTIEAAFDDAQNNMITNQPKADRIFKELVPYLLEQAFVIPVPTAYTYSLWQPWIKNYHGEGGLAYIQYYWIDQDLKTSLGY